MSKLFKCLVVMLIVLNTVSDCFSKSKYLSLEEAQEILRKQDYRQNYAFNQIMMIARTYLYDYGPHNGQWLKYQPMLIRFDAGKGFKYELEEMMAESSIIKEAPNLINELKANMAYPEDPKFYLARAVFYAKSSDWEEMKLNLKEALRLETAQSSDVSKQARELFIESNALANSRLKPTKEDEKAFKDFLESLT